MNYGLVPRMFVIILVLLTAGWVAPAAAGRLYPPCQTIAYQLDNPTTVRYSVVDPISGQTREETWTLTQGDERLIYSLQADAGILTWIARYKYTADPFYTYDVHYRIYDPGRGIWAGGDWGVFAGYQTQVAQHQVKDGVIAWKAQRQLGPVATSDMKYYVCYVTYDPEYGSWVFGYNYWQIPYNSPNSPENLRVQDGVVAWPMNPVDSKVWVLWTIYDQEVHRWVGDDWDVYWDSYEFDWVYIENATIHFKYGNWHWSTEGYFSYHQTTHDWEIYGTTEPWAYFIAQPASGCSPSWVCFWDASLAMNNRTSTSWSFGDGGSSSAISPVHLYSTPGTYSPFQTIYTPGGPYYHYAAVTVSDCVPPSGGIVINGGWAYTNSRNAILGLQASPDTVEMRFRNPMDNPFMTGDEWLAWEAFSTTRNWYLIKFFEYNCGGEYPVTVQFRDAAHNESPEYSASVYLDICPPSGSLTLDGGKATAMNPQVLATWSATDAPYGVVNMRWVAYNEEDGYMLWSPWQVYHPTNETFGFSSKLGYKTVIVEFMDCAGNISQLQASIKLVPASLPHLLLLLDD
jgi:hypothetical protein